jgi:hypothetical protein
MNASLPVIKLNFKPLNNPKKVVDLLSGLLIIKKGGMGNNITTGPLQYAYWRGRLTGEALRQFTLFSTNIGNETVGLSHYIWGNITPKTPKIYDVQGTDRVPIKIRSQHLTLYDNYYY